MKFNNIFITGSIALMAAAAVSSCGDDAITHGDLNPVVYPSQVELRIPQDKQKLLYADANNVTTLPLIKGETMKLEYSIGPDNITSDEVEWSSSNPENVSVDAEGNITALSADGTGYSIIQVAPKPFYASSGIASSVKVMVSDALVPATEISISSDADEVYAGETIKFSTTILPIESTYRTLDWTSSNTSVATVDKNGVVTGVANPEIEAHVTITARTFDGSNLSASKEIIVRQVVQPEDITIDQKFSVNSGYFCAYNEQVVNLDFTTVPSNCTMSLIEWTSSDESIATVRDGVVTLNQDGNFGNFTITATCPETGKSSSIEMNLAAGLIRELYHDEALMSWYGTNGTGTWNYGYYEVDVAGNANKARQDFRSWMKKVYFHAGEYPIFAVKMEDLKDKYSTVTARNITLDGSGGNCEGKGFSGGLNGNNNKWLHDYKCSDGSHVFIYSLTEQGWGNGGKLPTTSVATFNTITFKYADIQKLPDGGTYKIYWVQTFKSIADLEKYVKEQDNVTYEVIK